MIGDVAEYLGEGEEYLPLPEDVELSDGIINLAKELGLQTYYGEYYQVQTCIAVAEGMKVKRKHLCALMHLEGWQAEIRSEIYVEAASKAVALREVGYTRWNPLAMKDAITFYLQENEEYYQIFLEYSEVWEIAVEADVRIPDPGDFCEVSSTFFEISDLGDAGVWKDLRCW